MNFESLNRWTGRSEPVRRISRLRLLLISLASTLTLIVSGCAAVKTEYESIRDRATDALLLPEEADAPARMFAITGSARRGDEENLLTRHAPVFLAEADWSAWNRIGTPELFKDGKDRIIVRVDPTLPAIYGESRSFTGATGTRYTNLIYRVHFERVPLRFKPLNINAGRNAGLFVITTVNEAGDPVLYTTVHTCGCYVAVVPTDKLPEAARPDGWAVDEQVVYREKLPGMLVVPDAISDDDRRIVLTLRDGSHRVANIAYDSFRSLRGAYPVEPTLFKPMSTLEKLTVEGGGTASMFDDDGYVRLSKKPLEFALLSLWARDRRVGQDKRLGLDKNDGQRFYTSLNFKDQEASDMRDFGSFLAFRGWKL